MVATLAAVEDRRPPPAVLRVVNPVMLRLLRSCLHRVVSSKLMILSVEGRKTHRTIPVVVGRHPVDGLLLVSASGAWRHNLRGGAPVRVTLDGVEHTGHATLEEDPDQVARIYLQLLEIVGLDRASDLGLRVNVDRLPTADEIKPAVVQRAIARVQLDDDLHPPSDDAVADHRRQLDRPPSDQHRPRERGAEPTASSGTDR